MTSMANLESVVAAGAATLRDALGTAVAARDVQAIDDVATAAEGAVGTRVPIAGGSGAAVLLVPAEHSIDDSSIEAFLGGVVDAVGRVTGETLDAESPEPVDPSAVDEGSFAIFQLSLGDGEPVSVVFGLEGGIAGSVAGVAETASIPDISAAPAVTDHQPTVSAATLPDLGSGVGLGAIAKDLSVLADVAMTVTVELGRTKLAVRDLLSLAEGSVVELDQAAGSPVDVLVNGTVVAKGDVVVVEDELGVRITEVVQRPE